MSFCGCISATVFSILTISTIGVTFAATLAVFLLIKLKSLDVVSREVYIGSIIALVVVALVFLFAIYASCCGGRCAKFILFILYIAYAVAFAALGVFILVKRDAFIDELNRFWVDPKLQETAEIIEKAFHCACWNETLCYNGTEFKEGQDCETILHQDVHKYWNVIVGVTFGFAALIFLGASCACGYACCANRDSGEGIMYQDGYRRYR